MNCTCRGHTQIVRIMLGQIGMGRRAVDVRDEMGKTPLFEACAQGRLGSANVRRNRRCAPTPPLPLVATVPDSTRHSSC